MISAWTQHLKDPEEKQQFSQQVLSAKYVLARLEQILAGNEASIERSETDISSYDSPSWAYQQAHKNGYRACLAKIKAIINLDHKEQNA